MQYFKLEHCATREMSASPVPYVFKDLYKRSECLLKSNVWQPEVPTECPMFSNMKYQVAAQECKQNVKNLHCKYCKYTIHMILKGNDPFTF